MFRKKSLGLVNQRGRSSRSVASGEVKALRLFFRSATMNEFSTNSGAILAMEMLEQNLRLELRNLSQGPQAYSFIVSSPLVHILLLEPGKVWLDGNARKVAPRSVIDKSHPKPRLAQALH